MRPLTYLFSRSLANGVKRALTSPKRAISLIFFGCYYYFLIIRSIVPTPIDHSMQMAPALVRPLRLPDLTIIRGCAFAVFSFASVFMAAGMFSVRGGFRPADVDVLFPTPVKPQTVLVFRILRDYLLTLLAPLLLALLGWRGTSLGLASLFQNYPTHSMDALRATWIAWMLMSLAFVSMGYGVSLFVGRSDDRSDRNLKVLTYGMNGLIVATLAYVGFRLHENLSWASALRLSQDTVLNIVLLPATLASDFVMGSLQGNVVLILIAMSGLVCTIALGLALALTQVGWLYDQAAAKGFAAVNTQKQRRSGDYYGIAIAKAREGKKPPSAISNMISAWRIRSSYALVWKELLVQLRGPMSGAILTFCGLLLAYAGVGWVLWGRDEAGERSSFGIEVILPCFAAYMFGAVNGFGGFREMLRKVDLLKPLPITSGRIALFEVLSKVPIPMFMLAGGALELSVLSPGHTLNNVAGFIMGSTLLLEITGAILLSVTLFPDFDDPAQRGLSQLVMLLCIAICSSPGVGAYLLITQVLNWPPLAASIPAGTILVGITVGLSFVSGTIYAGYNPNE